MDQCDYTASMEWPKDGKWLWGPDGNRARFDSPADVPRDYTEERQAPKLAPAPSHSAFHVPVASASLDAAAVRAIVREELKAIATEKMAKARAAKAPKA